MMRFLTLAAAACLAAAPAIAQQRAQVRLNLSPAGQEVAKRYLGTPAPQAKTFAARAAAIRDKQRVLVAAPKLDMAQFSALLRAQERLQSEAMRFGNDRMIKMLSELSEPDRVAFLRGMSNPVAAPAPAAK